MGAAESCLQAMMVEEDQDDDDSPEDLLARFSIDYGVKYGQGGFGVTYQALDTCLLYTSPSPRDGLLSRMPSSA